MAVDVDAMTPRQLLDLMAELADPENPTHPVVTQMPVMAVKLLADPPATVLKAEDRHLFDDWRRDWQLHDAAVAFVRGMKL